MVLITGASQGIGAACARAFARRWRNAIHPDWPFPRERFKGRYTLARFLEYINYVVPGMAGAGNTGSRLSELESALDGGILGDATSETRWTDQERRTRLGTANQEEDGQTWRGRRTLGAVSSCIHTCRRIERSKRMYRIHRIVVSGPTACTRLRRVTPSHRTVLA